MIADSNYDDSFLQLRGICKNFPGVRALNNVHLEILPRD